MASHLYRTLKTDEVWMLYSQSVDKDPASYAPLEHRMAMGRILSRHYDLSIIQSDEEAQIAKQIGRNETYYILEELRRRHPDCKFIWAMGADSFANFHKWHERDDILEKYVVAVVGRPGYTEMAMKSPTARDFAYAAFDHRKVRDFRSQRSGWCFVDVPQIDVSSTELVEKFRRREQDFSGHINEIADYVYAHNLYQNQHEPSGQTSCHTPTKTQLPPPPSMIAP